MDITHYSQVTHRKPRENRKHTSTQGQKEKNMATYMMDELDEHFNKLADMAIEKKQIEEENSSLERMNMMTNMLREYEEEECEEDSNDQYTIEQMDAMEGEVYEQPKKKSLKK